MVRLAGARQTPRTLLACALFVVACHDADGNAAETSTTLGDDGPPLTCATDRGLFEVADVVADVGDPCHGWIEPLHGRAIRVDRPGGSASLWSRRTEHGTGIMTTAAHVLSPCNAYWTDQDDQGVESDGSCPEAFHDPKRVRPEAVIRLAAEGGGVPVALWSAHFALYNPFIPAGEYHSPTGLPRYDVSVYAVDSQTFQTFGTGLGIEPDPIVDAPLALYDPAGSTTASPTWADAAGDAIVLVLGYPETGQPVRSLHASIGRVLHDDEATQAIVTLRDAGDEEGLIAYDAEAEFLLEAAALPGMSGGGVFDAQGRQLGVVVRASFAEIGVQYVRAVRMRHLVTQMDGGFDSLPPEQRAAIAGYLESR